MIISNDGPGLDIDGLHENLFGLGFSTKSKKDRQIGQFGQGLNTAVAFFGGECTVFSRVSQEEWIIGMFSRKMMKHYEKEFGKGQVMIYVKFVRQNNEYYLGNYYLVLCKFLFLIIKNRGPFEFNRQLQDHSSFFRI